MPVSDPELPQNPTSDLRTVTAAYGDILKHNSEHTGFGAMFKGVLKSSLMRDDITPGGNPDSITPASIDEAFQENIVEGDMNAELQDILHRDTFLRAGIKLAPFGQYGSLGEGRVATSAELVPIIENTSLFTEFLSKLRPEDVREEDVETFLSDVVANLSKIVYVCFDTKKQEGLLTEEKAAVAERGEDALRAFTMIDPEYIRLGIDGSAIRERVENVSKELADYFLDSDRGPVVPTEISDEYNQHTKNQRRMRTYESMTKMVNYWGRNLLPEYLVAENGQYLTPPDEQGFGPSGWQGDGGQYHWQDAFDFLKKLEQDERTKQFAKEVRQGLVTSLDSALGELDDPNKDIHWRSQASDLANIRNALSGQQFDEAKLAAYITKPDHLTR